MKPDEKSEENVSELSKMSTEERINFLVHQNFKLYKQWTKDSEALQKGFENQEKMLEAFNKKLNQFEQLEGQVRDKISDAIVRASKVLSEDIREKVGNSATASVDKTAKELKAVVSDASHALSNYKGEVYSSQTRIILITIGTAIAASLLIVWFLTPKPVLPLTYEMFRTYFHGEILEATWSNLPKKTRKEFIEVAHEKTGISHPLSDLSSGDSGTIPS